MGLKYYDRQTAGFFTCVLFYKIIAFLNNLKKLNFFQLFQFIFLFVAIQ